MDELAKEIESYLLARKDWVPDTEICARFGLPDDRPLRSLGDRPGLASEFAISGNRGLKHVTLATTSEWLRFKHRLRRHGIGELVRVRNLDRRRAGVGAAIGARRLIVQKDTGQVLMWT